MEERTNMAVWLKKKKEVDLCGKYVLTDVNLAQTLCNSPES